MNKKLGCLVLFSALLLAISAPIVANAADTTGTTATDSTATTDSANLTGNTTVNVHFDPDTTAVTPVDPDHPEKPSTTGDQHNGAKPGGGLSLIYVTDTLDFGSQTIDNTNNKSYPVDITKSSALWGGKQMVAEVSDKRGTAAGWKLSVTGDALTGSNDKTAIKGASISLPKGVLNNTGATSNGAVPGQNPKVQLASGAEATEVLSAPKGSGTGTTTDQFAPDGITLNIPANTAHTQDYSTNLNWNIAALPES